MPKPRAFSDVIARLPDARQSGERWTAPCPLPGHTTPEGHLSLRDGGNMALVYCQGERHDFQKPTDYESLCRLLGFDTLSYGDNSSPGHKRVVVAYDYTDADGKLLYQMRRYEPKTFRPRRPDGQGGWIEGKGCMKAVRRVLYNLPQVLDAKKNGQIVYICEGEKDCDNMAKLGLTATTNSEGAGKWKAHLGEALAGASVVIIPDGDELGKSHAEKVAGSLCGIAKSLKVVVLPDRDRHKVKDVSDWLSAGGTKEELQALVREAKPLGEGDISLVCIADVEPETVAWLWFPYIPLAKLILLEGDPGIGKSWVSLGIATAVSLGKGLPGTDAVDSAAVLLASAEDGLGDTIRPRLDAMCADVHKIHAVKGALDFGNNGLSVLEGYIERIQPALVIVDPLVAYIGAAVDIHRANETRAVMAKLADIAERHGCAILAIRHLTKGGTLKPIYRGLGSIDLAAACRSILMAGSDPEDTNQRGIVHIKSNLAPTGNAIGYELKGDRFHWTGKSDLTWQKILSAEDAGGKSALDEAIEFLSDELSEGAVSYKQVIADSQGLGIAKRTLDRAKAQLGVIARPKGESGHRGARQWWWSLPGDSEGQNDLRCQDYHIKDVGNLKENSYENQRLPEGFGNLNGPDHYDSQALLGLTVEQVIEVWRAEGSPTIRISKYEICHNLAKTLSNSTISEAHINAITEWLTTILEGKRGALASQGQGLSRGF